MAKDAGPWWRRFDPDDVRETMTEINDGIIAVAGMALGLAGAEVSMHTAKVIILISSLAGALSVFGVKLGEAFAERESQMATVAEEQRLLELSPEEEVAELAEWFEAKGVSPETSHQVAKEMSDADALSAQLALEYGFDEVTTSKAAWWLALRAGLAFLLGSLTPILAVYFVADRAWRQEHTVITAVIALTLTSALLSWLGRSRLLYTIVRTLALGLGTLGLAYLLGDMLV